MWGAFVILAAYEYSPSDGTDGTLDEAETPQPSAQAANKLRKKRILRTSRNKHDNSLSPLAVWSNAVPRNLSADAVRATLYSELLMTYDVKLKIYTKLNYTYFYSAILLWLLWQ